MKIVISAGGTGGHIYPALTLARALKDRGHEVSFIGSNDRMEKEVIPSAGFPYVGLDVVTTRGSILQKIKSLFSIAKGYRRCLDLLKDVDMAIGFGNYISIPVMEAAIKLKKKTVIHEQNSFVGKANRLLDSKVDLVIGSYEENRKQFHNPNLLILGNPQSDRAFTVRKDPEVLRKMGLDPDRKTLVVFMGSLGSVTVNDVLIDLFRKMDGSYQVVYATGKNNYLKTREAISDTDWLKIFERIDGVDVMANSTLLLCRGGATTLCEVCALGMPAIIIPSPFVPNNHQYFNALALKQKDAAELVEEKQLDADSLKKLIDELMDDDERRMRMADNAKKLANPSVMDDIIEAVEKL